MSSNPDYYFNEKGHMVFTSEYLSKRGYCCGKACRHCPYNYTGMKDLNQRKIAQLKQKEFNGNQKNQ